MPFEHRQITFSLEEISRAVAALLTDKGMLPDHDSRIAGLRIVGTDDQLGGLVTVVMTDTSKVLELPLTAELLAAALIRYAREVRIPLPRVARKHLVRSADGLTMHLHISSDGGLGAPKAPSGRQPASPAAPVRPASGPMGIAPGADPTMPGWWSTMSRRSR